MKPAQFIPPVVALLIVVGWIGKERHATTTLEKESAVLTARLKSRLSGEEAADISSKSKSASARAIAKNAPDWKQVAEKLLQGRDGGGIGDIRTMMRLQQRIQEMSRDELIAALDEIEALDLSSEAREVLVQMLFNPLVDKDPELALTRFCSSLSEEQDVMSWRLSHAMSEWLEKDPAKAVAWFDQQIAAGAFDSKSLDGKSRSRLQFESTVIARLVSTDPTAAAARLKNLPEDQRKEAFSNGYGVQVKDEDQLAFATLIREGIPEEGQAGVIAGKLSGNDYAKVSETLDRIKATATEREAIVASTARSKISDILYRKGVTPHDIDEMREWATSQAPAVTDQVTGEILARSLDGNRAMDFSEAAALATKYHETSGNDDVLVSFLSSYNVQAKDPEEVKALAEKITDPVRRAEVLKALK